MRPGTLENGTLRPATRSFYRHALEIMEAAGIPFLMGGAYAHALYTGIVRHTKDIDIFVRPRDCQPALDAFAAQGYRTNLLFSHWLGKVHFGEDFIDIIFGSGNGLIQVDDEWFAHSVPEEVLGKPVRLCPVEEIIWMKAFVMERDRYDGADIAHLLRARAECLDWARLRRLFGEHWRLLICHLILFEYIYPTEALRIPGAILEELLEQLRNKRRKPPPDPPICQGTLLSREQYLIDINVWGYADARLPPRGKMNPQEIAVWTAAIGSEVPP